MERLAQVRKLFDKIEGTLKSVVARAKRLPGFAVVGADHLPIVDVRDWVLGVRVAVFEGGANDDDAAIAAPHARIAVAPNLPRLHAWPCFFHLLILLLFAVPAFAQVDVVAKYRTQYPTPMSADQKVSLLRQVAGEVHGGLLVKKDGTNCGGYSCDIICFSDVTLFDVLQDQDNLALPRWDATTNPRGYRCELVSGGQPPPPQTTPTPTAGVPVPSLDLSPIFARLDSLYAQNERIYADLTNQHHDQTATLKAAIDSPAWYSKLFGNQYVQLVLVGLGTYLTTHQVMK